MKRFLFRRDMINWINLADNRCPRCEEHMKGKDGYITCPKCGFSLDSETYAQKAFQALEEEGLVITE
jgi:uncharacterized Zn finger protein (UPF0148 family)